MKEEEGSVDRDKQSIDGLKQRWVPVCDYGLTLHLTLCVLVRVRVHGNVFIGVAIFHTCLFDFALFHRLIIAFNMLNLIQLGWKNPCMYRDMVCNLRPLNS